MDTAARAQLAREIAQQMAARHGDAILLGGVFGSAARGDDTPFSDLDLLFVTREGAGLAGRSLLFKHVVVSVQVIAAGERADGSPAANGTGAPAGARTSVGRG